MSAFYEYSIKPISDLVPYAKNSRTHSKKQVNQIAASIKEFGFTNPVLIDDKGGIIAGHGRILAAKEAGMETVPTITITGLTAAQKRALVISDNKLALNAGWDTVLLAEEIGDLKDDGYDISILGFEDSELTDILEYEPTSECTYPNDKQKYLLMLEMESERELEQEFSKAKARGLKCKIID